MAVATPRAQGSLMSYVLGFAISVILTLEAYLLVSHSILHGWALVFTIATLAIVQLIAQLVLFLHIGSSDKRQWDTRVLIFAVCVIVILVFGSIWIMYNLDYNHIHTSSSNSTDTYIIKDEGINP